MFLKSWWSKEYSRPLKDPILESYTLYDLLYEYYDKVERITAADEVLELEADKIEEVQEQNTLDWIEEEERKDREAAESAAKVEVEQKAKDEAWMVEQLKKEYGDDFGEDISTDFNKG